MKARVLDMMRSRGYGSLAYEPAIDVLIAAVVKREQEKHGDVVAYEWEGVAPDTVADRIHQLESALAAQAQEIETLKAELKGRA